MLNVQHVVLIEQLREFPHLLRTMSGIEGIVREVRKKMICNTILEAMGNTPMIRLQHMVDKNSAEILVKFEGLNVGGSI